jgi:hypothetical protein
MIHVSQSTPQTTKKQPTSGLYRLQKPKPVPVSPTIADPNQLVASLSDKEKKILNYITYWLSNKGYCDSSIPQIASAVECGETTVSRALARFKDLKLIYVIQRFNLSNFTYLNPYITQNFTWYSAFAKILVWIPQLVLSVSLLSSCGTNKGDLSGNKSIFTTTTPLLERVSMGSSTYAKATADRSKGNFGGVGVGVDKKVSDMKQFDAEKGHQCAKIARALLKRGAQLTQDEIRNLLAYDKEILERVSKAMRETKNIRNPSAFFFGLARKFQQESGIPLDWDTVQRVRHCGVRLVSDEEIANPGLILAEYKEPDPKKGTGDNPSYSEQVRKSMAEEKAAADARKGKQLSLDERIIETQGTIAKLETATGLAKQYADILLPKFRRTLEELTAERNGVVKTEPVRAQAPVLTQPEVKQWIQTLIKVDEFKAKEKESAYSHPDTPPSVQKSILEASSFTNEEPIEEISDEEALYYSGQCDPFAETENV